MMLCLMLNVSDQITCFVHTTTEGEFFIGYNHYLGLEKALVAGYRGLSLDVCSCGSGLQFCHNVCGKLFVCNFFLAS